MIQEYYISTDKSRLEVPKIHAYLSTVSYWGRDRSYEEVQTTIDNSLCFGIYADKNGQIGFARLVTDGVVFGHLMDVIVFDQYQGQGYGKALINYIMSHESIRKLKTIALKTKDAHDLYRKFGFEKIGKSDLWMTIDRVVLL